MCVLDNAFKTQNGKWLSKGKHRWGVVKAHRRESRKEKKNHCSFKNPNCIFKKIDSTYKKKHYVWKSFILFKFQEKMLTHTHNIYIYIYIYIHIYIYIYILAFTSKQMSTFRYPTHPLQVSAWLGASFPTEARQVNPARRTYPTHWQKLFA
jgi:hypothetical protein